MAKADYRIAAGILAILFYVIHAGVLIQHNEPYHILWSCHLGCLLVGIGLLMPQPWLMSVGFLWLAMGVPLWILNVLTRAELMVTSTLSHFGGLAIALYGFRFLKMPPFSWAASTAGLILLGFFSRFVTPRHANVNLSHAVWTGWEEKFPSYFWYVVMLLSLAVIIFLVLEVAVRHRMQGKK
ncbi:MAG: hypothetical protein PVI06_11665 [Desulfobacterales bacterium]|jgi:hypothetical protein